ncbi:site-specific tyrosine recombinase XerC [Bacillus paranthracis]|uniref:tyrosine-type recombinase/integrase n=1 Tax=Bacillus cereus group TaxID=86661 RepID=UPI000A301267|nr:tyrosine-type recombinase/integrase [Bacillus paranthracis]MCR6791550.1 tyrosine-type recombinase/integrase [Bacillus paranthracis]MED1169543.1 tyrosine-type recombinase/integrase [Bacillus paranthracis]SME26469.1 site-specific tyrosine recombinase XerC [Bacillus paranthracis]
MSNKKNTNYNIQVQRTLIETPRLESDYTIQYILTEDGLPLYEINRWLHSVSYNSYLTGKHYAYVLKHYLRFLKVKKIHYRDVQSKEVIESYIKYLLYGDETVSDVNGQMTFNSIKQRIGIVKGFYEWLEEQGEIQNNPVKYGSKKNNKTNRTHLKSKFLYGQVWQFKIEKSPVAKLRFRKQQSHIKWYTDDEIKAILQYLPTSRDKIIFKITLEAGTRIGETLGIHLMDYDSEKGTLMIKKNENLENEANAKTGERELYISDILADEISFYIRGERAENDIHFSDYLFINHKGDSKGKPVTPRNYLAILKRAAHKAGLDKSKIRTHSGRSTLAQILLEALHEGEITETFILLQMGWEDISTLKTYTRAYNEKNRKKIAKQITEKRINSPGILNKEVDQFEN